MTGAHPWPWTFGQTLRLIRTARGLTMIEAAALVGRNQSSLSRVESDKIDASPRFLADMANAYGCPWWGLSRNVHWLYDLARVYESSGGVKTAPTRGHEQMAEEMACALSITRDIELALQSAHNLGPVYAALMTRLDVANSAELSVQEHTPIWFWIMETLDIEQWAAADPNTAVERVRGLLDLADTLISKRLIDVDPIIVGSNIRVLRSEQGLALSTLVDWANEQIDALEPEDGQLSHRHLTVADLEKIEAGRFAPRDWLDYSALASALEVQLSQLLSDPSTEMQSSVGEPEVVEILRQFGLNDSAIRIVQPLLVYLKTGQEPNDPS